MDLKTLWSGTLPLLIMIALVAGVAALASIDVGTPKPAEQAASEIVSDELERSITGPRVTYIVPHGTERITARIKSPSGDLMREFVITNWISIKPGQRLELTAE